MENSIDVKKIKKIKRIPYTNKGKIKNGPIEASKNRTIPIIEICFSSSIIPLMINRILKNPIIKGKICENIIINPFAILSLI